MGLIGQQVLNRSSRWLRSADQCKLSWYVDLGSRMPQDDQDSPILIQDQRVPTSHGGDLIEARCYKSIMPCYHNPNNPNDIAFDDQSPSISTSLWIPLSKWIFSSNWWLCHTTLTHMPRGSHFSFLSWQCDTKMTGYAALSGPITLWWLISRQFPPPLPCLISNPLALSFWQHLTG